MQSQMSSLIDTQTIDYNIQVSSLQQKRSPWMAVVDVFESINEFQFRRPTQKPKPFNMHELIEFQKFFFILVVNNLAVWFQWIQFTHRIGAAHAPKRTLLKPEVLLVFPTTELQTFDVRSKQWNHSDSNKVKSIDSRKTESLLAQQENDSFPFRQFKWI